MRKLPEGYTPLEYIKYIPPKPPQMYLLHGYKTKEEAESRAKELYASCPYTEYKIFPIMEQQIKEYVILLPDMAVEKLTPSERMNLSLVPHTNQCEEYQPRLYRFMDEMYIDEFFKNGTLLLTTYNRCTRLEDPNRADKSEGRNLLIGYCGKQRYEIDIGTGNNVMMLCTSLSRNNKLPDGKLYDSCIEILNVNSFIQSITDSLLEQKVPIKAVIKGPCVYSGKTIQRTIPSYYIENLLSENDVTASSGSINFDILNSMMMYIGRGDIYFTKPIKYSYENEYRIVWLLDEELNDDKYIVTSPKAVEFCHKINFK